MTIEVYTVNSFTANGKGGNPAGVVIDQSVAAMGAEAMQKIASTTGFAETVFLQSIDKSKAQVRFFTPSLEIDFCGHASLAMVFLFKKSLNLPFDSFELETRAGKICLEVLPGGRIMMKQLFPEFGELLSASEIAEIVGLKANDVDFNDLPVQIVSTGIRDIFLPVKSEEALARIKPDFEALAELNRKTASIGLHAFTILSEASPFRASCRNFAPLYGIEEESATGSASGALACYLHKYWAAPPRNFLFAQGIKMNRPSEILARITLNNGEFQDVYVGGSAKLLPSIVIPN